MISYCSVRGGYAVTQWAIVIDLTSQDVLHSSAEEDKEESPLHPGSQEQVPQEDHLRGNCY